MIPFGLDNYQTFWTYVFLALFVLLLSVIFQFTIFIVLVKWLVDYVKVIADQLTIGKGSPRR